MSLVVERRSSPMEPAMALRGPLDVEGMAISLGSTLCLVSQLPHIFAGPGVMGPAVHFWMSSTIALINRLAIDVFY